MINGTKQFITNSGTDITTLVTVTAVTGTVGERGKKEISTILVPSGTPGFTAEPAYNKVGWNASDTHPLTFADVRVPEENLLGERGTGYANFLRILDEGRIAIAALATGAAQGCVDESVKYAKERQAFGQPIGCYQAISFKIARMEARAHVARTAYYDAAAMMLAGKPFKKEAAIAKMVACEAAMDNARDATQIHGGYGFMNEYPVARHYRDSKILEIGEGTTEVQLMLIARALGLSMTEASRLSSAACGSRSSRSARHYLHRPGRTVTEADNVLFTTLTMNTQSLHLDAAWAAEQPAFGRATGELDVHPVDAGRAVGRAADAGHHRGNLGFSEVSFPKPVFHGDTLYAETVCTDKRESKSRPGEGIVTLAHTGRNQHGDVVARAVRTTLVQKRPASRGGAR